MFADTIGQTLEDVGHVTQWDHQQASLQVTVSGQGHFEIESNKVNNNNQVNNKIKVNNNNNTPRPTPDHDVNEEMIETLALVAGNKGMDFVLKKIINNKKPPTSYLQ